MSCCSPIIQPFANVASLAISWGPIQQAAYGIEPNVQVYFQDGSEFVKSDFNEVKLTPGFINIDMGGPQSGIVKIF